MKKYYQLIQDSYYKGVCCIYPSKEIDNPPCRTHAHNMDMSFFENMTFRLAPDVIDAEFLPIHPCLGITSEAISKELK